MLINSHNKDNIEIRPRFKLISNYDKDDIIAKITDALPQQTEIMGVVKGNHFFLEIENSKQHYWSPTMEVVVERHFEDETKTGVRCLIGPRQTVWMMLMFFYVGIGVLALFGGMYGLVKWNLGKESFFIWAFPAAAILFGIIYITSKYGQKKGRNQMLYLVSFIYHAIGDDKIERL